MLASISQNSVRGSSTAGTRNSNAPPTRCSTPYSRSAWTHLSATMPISAGMNSEASPMVEKIAPNCAPPQ
jgi:hypothetical protein